MLSQLRAEITNSNSQPSMYRVNNRKPALGPVNLAVEDLHELTERNQGVGSCVPQQGPRLVLEKGYFSLSQLHVDRRSFNLLLLIPCSSVGMAGSGIQESHTILGLLECDLLEPL